MKNKLIQILLLALTFYGCVPFPHDMYSVPNVSIKTISNDTNYVWIIDRREQDCENAIDSAKVNGNQEIALKGKITRYYFAVMDPINGFGVCANVNNKKRIIYRNITMGAPDSIQLQCNLGGYIGECKQIESGYCCERINTQN